MNKHVILGGGIAGLACAIQLLKTGKKVSLFEKSPQNNGAGHAFILMPNGLTALKKLGLLDEVLKVAHPIEQFRLQSPNGKTQYFQELKSALGIRRASLIEIMMNALPRNVIQFEKAFSHFDFDMDGQAKRAVFLDGSEAQGNVFIGADGIWSKTRKTVIDDFSLSPVRIREIVSVIKAPNLVEKYRGSFLKTQRKNGGLAVGMLPCDDSHVVWFIQYDSHHPDLVGATLAEQKFQLIETIKSWAEPIPELVAKTDFKHSYMWHTTDMNPLPQFYRKNVGLIGDAAHVLLTLTSQGVSSALEDAICLTDLLHRNQFVAKVESTFKQYTFMRKKLTEEYFYMGRELKEQFLLPISEDKKIQAPLAFSAA